MEVTILKYIGQKIKELNPYFDTYTPNAVFFKDGQVVKSEVGADKIYVGISDTDGTAFYMRTDSNVTYDKPTRQFSSLVKGSIAKRKVTLVAYTFLEAFDINPKKVVWHLTGSLEHISLCGQPGEPSIELISSNDNAIDNVVKELKNAKQAKQDFVDENVRKDLMCVSVEFYLKYKVNRGSCEPCNDVKEIEC